MANSSRFALLRQLFEEVCDLDSERRSEHLQASGASTDLIAEVEALLTAETRGFGSRGGVPVAALLSRIPETELDVGDRVGAWRLAEKLASGGMGTVYRAERADGHFQQQAAIKLLRGIPTVDALDLLAQERQILAGLQHPHIARLLDGGATPGGQPYLVMEYVEGVAIDQWCEQRALDLKARLRLFRNVCRAVAFAHQRLIVHCDLKPSNVLVRADGAPVLLDFGIARAVDRAREQAGAAYYTPGYASPEQMEGKPVSVASDVYSLGLILFELVSGRKARLHALDHTVTDLTRAVRKPSELAGSQCRWPRQLRGDLDAIILRATAQRAGLRYASADALAEDIERHLDLKPVAARTPTLTYAAGRLLRRRWPWFIAAAGFVLMAVGFSWRLVNERDRALAAEVESRGQRDRALAAERQALSQADTARQISDFLISIFEFANPEKNIKNREISARDMLEESTRRLGDSLAEKPAVKARLLAVLARAWDRLGLPQRSIDLYRASVAQWQQAGAGYERDLARTLSDLGVMQVNNGMRAEAEKTVRHSLVLREALQPRNETELADSWNALGLVLREIGGRDAEAEEFLKRALAVRQRDKSDGVMAVMHNLAGLYANQGRLDESLVLHEQTLAAKRQRYGTDVHPSVIYTLTSYAGTLAGLKRYDEAVARLRETIGLEQQLAGAQSDLTASSYNELGSVLQDAGRYGEAMQAYRESIRQRRALPHTVPAVLVQPINNLGVALEEIGDNAAAEPLMRESLALRRSSLGADDPSVLRAEHNLARLLLRSGRLDEAQPLLLHCLAGRRAQLSATHSDLGRTLLLQVEWLRRAGRRAEAEAALQQLDASAVQASASLRGQREAERGRLALAAGRQADGVAALRNAAELLAQAHGQTHPLAAAQALELAQALNAQGQTGEAKALLAANAAAVEQNFVATAPVRKGLLRLRSQLR
ncbi:serine/threonine-protein kinase [Tahibacter aquaticus]|uniref:Serine/threonine-protein kinase n=1 Tax=Tahibacter aquaticus TaxID=520092 RepID=A0A4R6ZAE8_9GAMM|nr:serine/threonine-protein kinase [Tahibacter aquaticus]TDR48802.1 serine/threonine-protein kinase [Tahibacter aquaticus]